MASRESKPVKQLKDLLQEQQEPFMLEIYLLERGYLRNSLNSEVYFNCCHGNSTKSLKRSASCDQKKKQKSNPHCSKVFRAVHKQVATINERLRTRSHNVRDGNSDFPEESKNTQEVAELDRFSSASSTTVFNSCSETEAEETSASKNVNKCQTFRLGNNIEKEVVTDRRNLQPQFKEGCNQHSPVSVLKDTVTRGGKAEEINAMKDINSKRFKFTTKVMEDSVLSASLWEILVNSGTQKPNNKLEMQELVKSKTFSQYTKSKTVLHQTRQLLFDCIREVVETQERKKQQQHGYQYLETEELGRLLGKKEKKWEKHSGKGSNLTKLLELDFVDSAQEWSEQAQQLGGIVKQIQESILEDMKDEIVLSMLDSGP